MSRPRGSPDAEYQGRLDGLLLVDCWCQATTVLVTPADVRNGRTGTCDGGEWCRQRPRRRP